MLNSAAKRVGKIRFGRLLQDKLHLKWMQVALGLVMLLPLILALGMLLKSALLIETVPLTKLLFSKTWKPLSGEFGFYPFIISSVWVTVLALLIAAPICLLTAIHLTQYARRRILKIMHPVIDILAGLPSVIYGVWGVLVVVPLIGDYIAPLFGKETTGYSILAGAIVLAIMIIPFILNILIEVFNAIPNELSEASLSLGASKWQTIKKVLVRKALPGMVSAFGLGMSRAFGETIAVLMVVGNVPQIPKGVFQPGYPLPALIANNYGEMLSIPLYDSALMLAAFILFVVVLLSNLASRLIIINSENRIK